MYRFDLELKRIDGEWRVAEAEWEEVPPAQAP
jgi:hypothetical protein